MDRKPFRFKKFTIHQDKTAMKVGTDGVLLGSWAKSKNASNVLDIGTGTGLIALMMAQRYPNCCIDALEIDYDAFLQAKENIISSNFKKQINIYHIALQNFVTDKKYDLIISNPPFFIENKLTNNDDARSKARQQIALSFYDLLLKTSNLLINDGVASFIIPYNLEDNFIKQAQDFNLFLNRVTHVKGNETSAIKRSLLTFSFTETNVIKDILIIEKERHQYTEEYINLTKEFYFKM